MPSSLVKRVIVLGGGSAGWIAAATLKRRLPQLEVTVLRSPDIGVIAVGLRTRMESGRGKMGDWGGTGEVGVMTANCLPGKQRA